MDKNDKKASVGAHYDAIAANYSAQYNEENLYDLSSEYPANFFRLQLLQESFTKKNIKRIVEVGVGEGTPLVTMAKTGMDAWGFDIAEQMVVSSKEHFKKSGFDPEHISWGDIQDTKSYSQVLSGGQFDGVMAMGVMPHVKDDDEVLENIASLIKPGGSVFIEFRNKLFSLFTFNRYTSEFILNDLLAGVDEKLKSAVAKELESKLRMDLPPLRLSTDGDAPGYDAILSKFHNPFEVVELFKKHKFENIQLRWYHYHPAMPYLESTMPELFRKEAVGLEHEESGWKGMFLCSAFVIEAVKAK